MNPSVKTLASLMMAFAASTASAAITNLGSFSGNDCQGGGFANCYASSSGVSTFTSPPTALGWSPVIYKRNSSDNQPTGSQDFGSFVSIDGSEFVITYDANNNTLSFTYTPGANDPEIHFFTMKQANGFVLFGDSVSPITSATVDLDNHFQQPGWSHITFFDTGVTPTSVPLPASMALLALGLGLVAVNRRRAR